MYPLIYQNQLTEVFTSIGVVGSKTTPWLGSKRCDQQGNVYQFVKNTDAAALVVGDVVTRGVVRGEVLKPTTATLDRMAGAAMGAIPASGFGWVQVQGDGLALVDGTVDLAAGDTLKAVNASKAAVKDTAAGTASTFKSYMRILAAYTTDLPAVKPVFIDCNGL